MTLTVSLGEAGAARFDLEGASFCPQTDPILVLETRLLILVLPALPGHLHVEMLLPLGQDVVFIVSAGH